MSLFFESFLAALLAILLENVIFTAAFGTSTLIAFAKRNDSILFCGLFITEFSLLSSITSYGFEKLISGGGKVSARFLPTLYIISLGAVYIVTLLVIWFASKDAFKRFKKYIHLSAFNCTVLSVLFSNALAGGDLGDRILFAVQVGVGFVLAAYILSINYEKLNSEDVPKSFAGFPIYTLYIGIVAMVIYALNR